MPNPFAAYIDDETTQPKATTGNPFAEYLPPEAAPDKPGMMQRGQDFVSGLGDVVNQGWSAGGSDELGSAIQAGARKLTNALTGSSDESFGELYDERLKQKQGDLRDFREAHPVASIVGEIAGAAPTAALGGAAAGMSKLPALAKALIGGGAGVGISKAVAGRTARKAGDEVIEGAASADDLRQAARTQYDIADSAQGTIPEKVYSGFVGKLGARLKNEGGDAMLHPKIERVMSLMVKNSDTPQTLQDLQILRRQLGTAAKSGEADERRLGQIAIDQLDDFVENSAGELGGVLKEGRALWARLRKSEVLDDAIEAATTRAAGTEAGLRNEFSKLARNKKLMRGFSAEEKNAIKSVSSGTPTRNALRILGGLSIGEGQRRNILSALAGGGLGAMAAGPGGGMAGMAAPAIVGGVAQKMAEKGTMRAAKLARAITAGPRPTQATAGMTPPPTGPGAPRLPAPRRPALDAFLEEGAQRRLR